MKKHLFASMLGIIIMVVPLSLVGTTTQFKSINTSKNAPTEISFSPTISLWSNFTTIDFQEYLIDGQKKQVQSIYFISASNAYEAGLTSIDPKELPTRSEFLSFGSSEWKNNMLPLKTSLEQVQSNFSITYSTFFEGENINGSYCKVENNSLTSTFRMPIYLYSDEENDSEDIFEWYFIGSLDVATDDKNSNCDWDFDTWYQNQKTIPEIKIFLNDMKANINGEWQTIETAIWQEEYPNNVTQILEQSIRNQFGAMNQNGTFKNENNEIVSLTLEYSNYYNSYAFTAHQSGVIEEFNSKFIMQSSNSEIEVIYSNGISQENNNWIWWTIGSVVGVAIIGGTTWFFIHKLRKNKKTKGTS